MVDCGLSMEDQGIIRVHGKEFGPVDIETLHEWKREGRLLAQNPARRVDVDLWTRACEIPGLFESPPAPENGGLLPLHRRTLTPIFTERFPSYAERFSTVFSFSRLIAVP